MCRTLHPITFGDYPKTMKKLVGCRLPKFNRTQSELLKGSIDFLGLNYYTARYAEKSKDSCINPRPETDSGVNLTSKLNIIIPFIINITNLNIN